MKTATILFAISTGFNLAGILVIGLPLAFIAGWKMTNALNR